MYNKIFTPLFGSVLGLISFETMQSILISVAIAFLGGIAAACGKLMFNSLVRVIKRKFNKSDNEKTIG